MTPVQAGCSGQLPLKRLALVALLASLVFFGLRVGPYDLVLALEGSDLMLPIKLISDPGLLAGHPLRDLILGRMSPAQRLLAEIAARGHLDALAVEYARLLVFNVLIAFAILAASWTLFRDTVTAVLSVVLLQGGGLGVLALSYTWWNLGYTSESHYLGFVIGVLVLTALYREAYVWACAGVAVLLWVHPAHAAITGLAVLAVYGRRRGVPTVRDIVRCGAVFVPLALPAVIYLGRKVGTLAGTGVDADLWWQLMRARIPHHLFPFSWSARLWFSVLVFLATGLLLRLAFRRARDEDGDVAGREVVTTTLLLTFALICAAGVVFSEVVPLVLPTKFALVRASAYMTFLVALYFCAAIRAWLGSDRPLLVVAGFAVATALVWADYSFKAALAVAVAAAGLAYVRPATLRLRPSGRLITALASASALALIAMVVVHVHLFTSRFYGVKAWKDTQLWARENTPRDTTFLVPLDMSGFEVFSERAAVITINDLALSNYSAAGLTEGLRRFRAFAPEAGVPLTRDYLFAVAARYTRLDVDALIALGRRFGARYAILRQPAGRPLPQVFANDRFVIYRLQE